MSTGPAVWVAFAGIVAALGTLILGILALLLAFVLFGMAIIILAGEVEGLRNPPSKEPPHPLRYACPRCGGDVYVGQTTCPACGHALPAPQTPKGSKFPAPRGGRAWVGNDGFNDIVRTEGVFACPQPRSH
jgi:hypothetical protein